jgi:MFS family permease
VRARLGTMFQSLTIRNYRLFATGQITKLIGVWMQFTAQDWLVLKLSNNSAQAVGVVTALQFVPVLALTLYGGKLADRYDKRRMLVIANGVFSVLALSLGLLVVTDSVTLHWVFAFALLMGVANAIETPIRQAFASEMVPRELLANALSLSAATFNSARVIGPALAGLAIAAFDLAPVFLLNTLTYLAPMVGLLRMRASELHRASAPATDTRIREGLRYVRARQDLVLPMALILVVGLAGFNFQLTLAVLAKNVFHTPPELFGLLTTALAVGALGGALASSGRRSRPSVWTVIGAAVIFGALETVVGFTPNFATTVVLLVPTGFFMILFAQATNQRIQMGLDATYRGRVMALFVLVFVGTTPVGAPLLGWLMEHYGARAGILLGGVMSLLAALAALAYQLRRSGARIRVRLRPLPKLYVVPGPTDLATPTAVAVTGTMAA